MNFVICEKNKTERNSDCYLGTCKDCPGIGRLKTYMTQIFEDQEITEIIYPQWVNTPQTILKNIVDNDVDFISTFCEQVKNVLPHDFIAKKQSAYYKDLKNKLEEGHFLVSMDFSENYAFIAQNAPPGFHWFNNQATVFVSYYYYKDAESGKIESKGFVVISDNRTHDAVAVYTFMQLLIKHLKNNFSLKKIDYFTDGAPQQFKNFKNVINLYNHAKDFKVAATWNFFPTAHGKGASDGVGGSVKRAAAKASLRLPPTEQILSPEALYNWLENNGNFKNVDFAFSPKSDYDKNVEKLKKRFENASQVKDIKKFHCINPLSNGRVECKVYSGYSVTKQVKIIKS